MARWEIGQLKIARSSIQPFRKGRVDWNIVEQYIVDLRETAYELGMYMLVMENGNLLVSPNKIKSLVSSMVWNFTNLAHLEIKEKS